jgi:hypothetical protein
MVWYGMGFLGLVFLHCRGHGYDFFRFVSFRSPLSQDFYFFFQPRDLLSCPSLLLPYESPSCLISPPLPSSFRTLSFRPVHNQSTIPVRASSEPTFRTLHFKRVIYVYMYVCSYVCMGRHSIVYMYVVQCSVPHQKTLSFFLFLSLFFYLISHYTRLLFFTFPLPPCLPRHVTNPLSYSYSPAVRQS